MTKKYHRSIGFPVEFLPQLRTGAVRPEYTQHAQTAARGTSLDQNAIVGVFLRVLEYYHGVLFLTTNRADLVDDAIASRCIAKITYKAPTPEAQSRIWRILSDTAGVELKDAAITKIVKRYPELTGRDIKNLLKLARLIQKSTGKPITSHVINFVRKFKATN